MRTDHIETNPSRFRLQPAVLTHPAFTRLDRIRRHGSVGRHLDTDCVTRTLTGGVCPPGAAGPELTAAITRSVSRRQEHSARLKATTGEGAAA